MKVEWGRFKEVTEVLEVNGLFEVLRVKDSGSSNTPLSKMLNLGEWMCDPAVIIFLCSTEDYCVFLLNVL